MTAVGGKPSAHTAQCVGDVGQYVADDGVSVHCTCEERPVAKWVAEDMLELGNRPLSSLTGGIDGQRS